MELSQKYVYTVWKNQSFSIAAKALFVSQPSLSAMVAKLETELGFKIFDRSTHPISATAKGRIYLNYLEEIHEVENQLYNQLAAANDAKEFNLSIGGRTSFALLIFPTVSQQLIQKHPNLNLTLDVESTEKKLRDCLIDLQITFYPSEKEYTVIPVQKERLLVAIHKKHPAVKPLEKYALSFKEISTGDISPEKEINDSSILSHVPFIKSGRVSDSDGRLSNILKEHAVATCNIINSRSFESRYRLAQHGLGALFVSDFFLKQFWQGSNELCYFAIQSPYAYRTTYVQYRKDSSKRNLLEEFVSAILNYCQNSNSSFDC